MIDRRLLRSLSGQGTETGGETIRARLIPAAQFHRGGGDARVGSLQRKREHLSRPLATSVTLLFGSHGLSPRFSSTNDLLGISSDIRLELREAGQPRRICNKAAPDCLFSGRASFGIER